jgi:hypothetical protein
LSFWCSSRNDLSESLVNRFLFYLTEEARPFIASENGFCPGQPLVNGRLKYAQRFQPDEVHRIHLNTAFAAMMLNVKRERSQKPIDVTKVSEVASDTVRVKVSPSVFIPMFGYGRFVEVSV